ncbi:MAG TPA: hypothetical protein VFQ45_05575 [Longimicrobium sp.]|nr:hypothetical protein [Longimicrobium sp.]
MRILYLVLTTALLALAACSADNPAGPSTGSRLISAPTAGTGEGCAGSLALSAACYTDQCNVGPPSGCVELLYDTTFDEYCPRWVGNSYASIGSTSSTGAYWDLQGNRNATLYQTVDVTPYSFASMEINAHLDVLNPGGAGTEKLWIEIRDASTNWPLQVVAMLPPSAISSYNSYSYPLFNFSGQRIKLQFRVVPGSAPGNTTFRINGAWMFGGY